jgi:hypothetical protein
MSSLFYRNSPRVQAASFHLPLNHISLAGVKLLKELIPGNGQKNEKVITLNGTCREHQLWMINFHAISTCLPGISSSDPWHRVRGR